MSVFGLAVDTRARRRLAVARMYGSYWILCAGGEVARSGSGGWAALGHVSIGLAGMVLLACWASLTNFARGVVLPAGLVRTCVWAAALMGVLCYHRLATQQGSSAFWFGVVFFVASLPLAAIAWTKPDPAPAPAA
jgi:hypothetical protein